MASKDEIKLLYTEELKQTVQYTIVQDMKQTILNSIKNPGIQTTIVYAFSEPQSSYDISLIQQCFFLEFGFELNNIGHIGNTSAVIQMINFLM